MKKYKIKIKDKKVILYRRFLRWFWIPKDSRSFLYIEYAGIVAKRWMQEYGGQNFEWPTFLNFATNTISTTPKQREAGSPTSPAAWCFVETTTWTLTKSAPTSTETRLKRSSGNTKTTRRTPTLSDSGARTMSIGWTAARACPKSKSTKS